MSRANQLPTFPIGALELILECQEILLGERTELTSAADYTEQRRQYWQMQALRPRQAKRTSQNSQAA